MIAFNTSASSVVALIAAVEKSANGYHDAGLLWALDQVAKGDEFDAQAADYIAVFEALGTANGGDEKEQAAFAKNAKKRINASRAAAYKTVCTFATDEQQIKFLQVATTSRLVKWLKDNNLASRSMQENLLAALGKAQGIKKAFNIAEGTNSTDLIAKLQTNAANYLAVLGKHTGLPKVDAAMADCRHVASFDLGALLATIEADKKPVEEPATDSRIQDVVEAEEAAYAEHIHEGENEAPEAPAAESTEATEVPKTADIDSSREPAPAINKDQIMARLGQLAAECQEAGKMTDLKKALSAVLATIEAAEGTDADKKAA